MVNLSTRSLQYDMVIYSDEKASGTGGGDFNSGAMRTRALNTTTYSRQTGPDWASLASNQITLQSGDYLIEASAPVLKVAQHITQFQNMTDATTAITGTAEFSSTADFTVTRSFILGVVSIDSAKTFELQHQSQGSKAGDGFGVASSITTNTYSIVKITKLK